MATFRERAAHSVYRMFSSYYVSTPGLLKLPSIITDHSKAVFLLGFSIACFGVSFGDASPYV